MSQRFAMTSSQQLTLTIKEVPDRTFDGPPAWQTSNPAILTLEPAADGLSCLVKGAGAIGAADVTVAGDIDPTTGQTIAHGVFHFNVSQGNPAPVVVDAGPVTEQNPEENPDG